jgi:putative FmdB family regulatory protein
MPIYEYECSKCCEVTEALQKISDPPLKKCPHCGGKLNKLMSLGSFHLKGDGWYVTDYKGKNSSTASNNNEASKTEKKEKKADKKTTPAKSE